MVKNVYSNINYIKNLSQTNNTYNIICEKCEIVKQREREYFKTSRLY